MSIIVFSCQNCDEQQFQTPSCALHTFFSVIKLNLVIQALLLDYILPHGKKIFVDLRRACILFFLNMEINISNTKYTTKSTIVSLCSSGSKPPTL